MPKATHNGPDDLDWMQEELQNLAFVAERAGFAVTARDLRYALRSLEVELRERAALESSPFSA